MSIVKDIAKLFAPMRPIAESILTELNRKEKVRGTGITWIITETLRTTARQKSLYAQGRYTKGAIVTNCDGVHALSHHQYGLAFDMAPTKMKGGKQVLCYSDPDVDWGYVGHLARAAGVVSGMDWNSNGKTSDESFVDQPHVEWNRKDRETYRKAYAWALENQG